MTACAAKPTQSEAAAVSEVLTKDPLRQLDTVFAMVVSADENSAYGIYRDGENTYATIVDFATAKQRINCPKAGCTHSDETCGAWLFKSGNIQNSAYIITDGEQLYYFLNVNNDSYIETAQLDGSNRTRLCDTTYFDTGDFKCFKDSEALYFINADVQINRGSSTPFNITNNIVRIDLATGEATTQSAAANTSIAGVCDESFIFEMETSLVSVPKDGSAQSTILEWQNEKYATTLVKDGYFYGVKNDAAQLDKVNLATGEKTEFPLSVLQTDYYMLKNVYDGKLLLHASKSGLTYEDDENNMYAIDVETGEQTQLTLTQSLGGGRVQPISIITEGKNDFFVSMDSRQYVVYGTTDVGLPDSQNTDYPVYGLINKADYFGNVANYREVEMLSYPKA